MITDDDIYALQAHAVATNDMRLLYTTYDALGVSRRYAFCPVIEGERRRARESCAANIEMMRAMGEQLRTAA